MATLTSLKGPESKFESEMFGNGFFVNKTTTHGTVGSDIEKLIKNRNYEATVNAKTASNEINVLALASHLHMTSSRAYATSDVF